MTHHSTQLFALSPLAASVITAAVYGGKSIEFAIQPAEREDHILQKQILAELLHAHESEKGSIAHFAGLTDPTSATLIDFRQDYPGLIGKPIVLMRCMPMYFLEVQPPENWVIHHRHMDTRLMVARQTGLLVMGPNEAIALVLGYASDQGSQIVKAFMTDEHGFPRQINGLTPQDRRITGSQPQIAALNVHEAANALRQALTDSAIEAGLDTQRASPTRTALLKRTVLLLSEYLPTAPQERKPSGAVIERWFREGGASAVDHLTRSTDGWVRYPTHQDAWYCGVWVHFNRREILSYTEGDVAHVKCLDERCFHVELLEMARFYGRDRSPAAVGFGGDGAATHFYESLFRLTGERSVVSLRKKADEQSSRPLFVAVDLMHPVFSRLSPEDELSVPADAFEVDLLDPLAFVPHQLRALRSSNGIAFILDIEGGDQRFGQIER